MRIVGFVLLLAGVFISMAIGLLYLPTFFAAVWVMTRDEQPPVQFRANGAGKVRTAGSVGLIITAALFAWSCSRTEKENQCSGV